MTPEMMKKIDKFIAMVESGEVDPNQFIATPAESAGETGAS